MSTPPSPPLLSFPAKPRDSREKRRRPSLTILTNRDSADRPGSFISSRVNSTSLREHEHTMPAIEEGGPSRRSSLPEDMQSSAASRPREASQAARPGEDSASIATAPAPSFLPLRPPRSLGDPRKPTLPPIDTIPRQTIMKALASRPPMSNAPSLPLAASLSGLINAQSNNHNNNNTSPSTEENDTTRKSSNATSQTLSAALANLQFSNSEDKDSLTARYALKSPCFFHQRFDDAVNIQKVLEEIADDEWLSHSRLVQTATGVREVSKQLQRRPIKRAVKTVMIITKARDNSLVYLTRELAEWLISTPRYGNDVGVNVYVDAKLKTSKRFDAPSLIAKDPRFKDMLHYWTPDMCWTSPEKFDLVLTLGGDGTVLFTSWLFQRIVPPVLSFSLGSLGFLTNFEFSKYREHLNHIMGDGGMRVNLRMRFTCTVFRADRSKGAAPGDVEEGEQFEVLNELVIDRGPSPYVSNLELYGDNELLTVVQADGCIFSTPTGK